ncbi:MAG: type I-F CRISPR-associated protein Csy2 [bacterium]
METLAYITLPNMQLQDANIESNAFVSGLPAMTAFTGYGHALERWLHHQDWALYVEGVAVLLHSLAPHRGHPKCPDALQGTKIKDIKNPRIIEELKADLSVTLVFHLVGDDSDDELLEQLETDFDDDEFRQQLTDWVYHTPCCGGHCQAVDSIDTLTETEDGTASKARIQRHLRRLELRRPSWFIIPRHDLIQHAQQQGLDSLDALFNAVRLRKMDEHSNKKYYRDQDGWIIPLAVGYQALETPQQRPATRKAQAHVYAETLTGLGELLHAKKVLALNHFTLNDFLWVHRTNPEQHLYYVTTKEFYYG